MRSHSVVLALALLATALLATLAAAQGTRPPHGRIPAAPDAGRGIDAGTVAIDASVDSASEDEGNADAAWDSDAVSLEARRARASYEFSEGLAAYGRGDYAQAAQHFAEANATLPDPAPVFNMARSFESANDVPRAIDAFRQYLAMAPNAPDAVQVRQRLDTLQRRSASLFVSTDPPGAHIFVDDEAQPQPDLTPVLLHLSPGSHILAFDHEGFQRSTQRVEIHPGATQTLAIVLVADGRHPATPGGHGGDPRIVDRRSGPVSVRFSLHVGGIRPWDGVGLGMALGGDATLFIRRSFATRIRFERLLDPDSAWSVLTGEAGYVLPFEDLDFGVYGFAGAGFGWINREAYVMHAPLLAVPVTGLEARLDWVFHPRLSVGLFFRLTLRNFFVADIEALNSFGASVSLSF